MKSFLVGLILMTLTSTTFAQGEIELPKVKGVIRQIDLANAKIRIRHEEIPNLNMPAMTMVFRVADTSILNNLVVTDKILFTSDEVDGDLTVLWIEKQVSEP